MMKTALLLGLFSLNTEHQIRLCDDNEKILRNLNLKKKQEKKSLVYYLDTEDKKLSERGLSVRIRVKQNKAEMTLKKRLGDTNSPGPMSRSTVCEYDLHGSSRELSCKIDSTIEISEFENILRRKKNWTEVISAEQLDFLKKYGEQDAQVFVYGTLTDHRYKWEDKSLGEITLDLVEQNEKEEIKYNEISIRYDQNDFQVGRKFEEFFRRTGIKACENQLDWPVTKFDTLTILN
jgi:uncharacterized protein YjbK